MSSFFKALLLGLLQLAIKLLDEYAAKKLMEKLAGKVSTDEWNDLSVKVSNLKNNVQ